MDKMKEILKTQLEREVSNLLKLHTEHDAFDEFINYLESYPELKKQFNSEEISNIFPKPKSIESVKEVDINEEGDTTTSSEYTDFDSYSLQDLKEFGWLNDESLRQQILSDPFYKNIVIPSIGDMPLDVKNEIQLHSSHILGRCNNPNDWRENIQGLVYCFIRRQRKSEKPNSKTH